MIFIYDFIFAAPAPSPRDAVHCESETTLFGFQKGTQLEVVKLYLQHCSRKFQPKY